MYFPPRFQSIQRVPLVFSLAAVAATACGGAAADSDAPPALVGKTTAEGAEGPHAPTLADSTPPISRRGAGGTIGSPLSPEDQETADAFHKMFYYAGEKTWHNTRWLGVRNFKNPLDMWIYQEILYELRPDVIIEAGTAAGGSALFLATICDNIDHGRIVTIDIQSREEGMNSFFNSPRYRPDHPRISYVHGSTTDPAIQAQVVASLSPEERVLVILDSDHSRDHVRAEMDFYHQLVTEGSYLIVEDTNLGGNPVWPQEDGGPMAARDAFMAEHAEFRTDLTREKFFVTQNPRGFLLRVAPRGALPRP